MRPPPLSPLWVTTTTTTSSSFLEEEEQQQQHSPPPPPPSSQPSSSVTATVQHNTAAATDAFHRDMRRVLESRRGSAGAVNSNHADTTLDNHRAVVARRGRGRQSKSHGKKPAILTSDVDGAQRCLLMLRHLRDTMNAATEESYRIVMEAFLQRGRTRWRNPDYYYKYSQQSNNNSNNTVPKIICAADQLEILLEELEEATQKSKTGSVRTATYNLALRAYANCATPRGERRYAERAAQLLERMRRMPMQQSQPDLQSHLHVLHAFAWQQVNRQPGDCAAIADRILQQHILASNTTAASAGNDNNNNNSTAATIDATGGDESTATVAAIQMQAYAYTLEAWSKSAGGGAPRRCVELLRDMQRLNATSNNSSSRKVSQYLDPEVYSNAILAWSKADASDACNNDDDTDGDNKSNSNNQGSTAQRAHALLLELLEGLERGAFGANAEPPQIAFNSVLMAWGRERRPDMVDQVLELLEEACLRYPNLKPDTVMYNSILHSYLSGPLAADVALQKSLDLLEYMETQSRPGGPQPSIAPDAYSYYTLLKCWVQQKQNIKSKSRPGSGGGGGDAAPPAAARAALEAEKLLHRMEERWDSDHDTSVVPHRGIYNMVINAFAKSGSSSAPQRALDLLQRK